MVKWYDLALRETHLRLRATARHLPVATWNHTG